MIAEQIEFSSAEEFLQEVNPPETHETPTPPRGFIPRTPNEIAEMFSKHPINVWDRFCGIYPDDLTPEEFERRYPLNRRIRQY